LIGEDRFEKLAAIHECSMEDIFSCAKEVQEAFDIAHQEGRLNEEGDGWTYDVWVDLQ